MADVPEITAAVARTLQALRADRGWSLDQLAARSGVSKGVLVALEQGRSNPNLATLARIGDAFGVPVTAEQWLTACKLGRAGRRYRCPAGPQRKRPPPWD